MKDKHTLDPNFRILALTHLTEGRLTLGEVAARLQVSERQVQRLHRAFLERGAGAVAHGNKDKRPANALDPELAARIVELARTKYALFNHSHFAEMLRTEEDIEVSRRTISRLLGAHHEKSPKTHRTKIHRRRRERRAQEGQMVQADGSEHAWLEDRGPKFTLIAGIDDATSNPWAHFAESEDTQGYFQLLWLLVMDRGIPHSWYCDRDSVFTVNDTFQVRDPFFDEPRTTQFGRALGELGVELILANSPQGKGRIERFFDTAQDRLVSLLRLHNARTIDDARLVLPIFLRHFRQQFAVPAREPQLAWLPWPAHLEHQNVFCFKYKRKLSRNHTVPLHGMAYDVPPSDHRRVGTHLIVCRQFDGTIRVLDGQELLATHPLQTPAKPTFRPAQNHPWRRPRL